jgi:hypothetical protein
MRFNSLVRRGFSLSAVCGHSFDTANLPALLKVNTSQAAFGRFAIGAVSKARTVSYVERGILPPTALRQHNTYGDRLDAASLHLIIHRGNCLYGAIRCSFFRSLADSATRTHFEDVLSRHPTLKQGRLVVIDHLTKLAPGSDFYLDVSGWLVNPDLAHDSAVAFALPAAVWAFSSLFPGEFSAVAALRMTNAAARTIERMGAEPILSDMQPIQLDDPFYRGQVQLMALHSRRYNPKLADAVQALRASLLESGIIRSTYSNFISNEVRPKSCKRL